MEMSIYEDGSYLLNNPTWHAEDSVWKADRIKNFLIRNNLQPKSLCEVGCGAGEILREMHDSYPNIDATGYEVSPQAYEICKPKSRDNLRFEYGDPAILDVRYHVVLVIDVIEHVEDYIGFLKGIRKIGENFVFHIPLEMNAQYLIREKPLAEARKQFGHLHHFSKKTATATLTHCGYNVIDCAYTYTYTRLEGPHRPVKTRLVAPLRTAALFFNEDLAVRILGGCSLLVLAN